MLVEALKPLLIHLPTGDVHLEPGVPVELPDEHGRRLLAKVPDKVRIVTTQSVVVEPAIRPDGSPLTPVYWERGDGSISGPASVEFFYRLGDTDGLIVEHRGELVWINASSVVGHK
ncbi:MAG: hypothetical protein Nkreftii_002694 [Candidatus Nitrospira kreftii]|uniref:Uncharacterized protein n=1 Tax=Candidatus Nitrospira kreftii TaxID=2652173 RepID=A0A7S8J0E8_9BACT|nr:MAG: hypothetical protein Nkreftii_002694 [Candidatus Nitrospira kreftii]